MKEQILNILSLKQPKYITKEFFIKIYSENLYLQLLEKTNFLSINTKLIERLYCILYDINKQPYCMSCNKSISTYIKFDMHPWNYQLGFCSRACIFQPKKDITINLHYNEEELYKYISTNGIKTCVRNDIFIYMCYEYCKKYNIDYTNLKTIQLYYLVKNKQTILPKCKTCNKIITWYKDKGEYTTYCSYKCAAQSNGTKEKRQETTKNRYGVTNIFQNKQYMNQSLIQRKKEYKENVLNRLKNVEFISENYNTVFTTYKFKCKKCNTILYDTLVNGHEPRCYKCNPIKTSYYEELIKNYLNNINIEYKIHDRTIISPLEVDFYIPSKNIAIELDSLYYHCENTVDKNYHLNKTNLCENKGIRLIHIFSDELINKPHIVYSRLNSILGINTRIFARKCTIREITSKEKNEFLEQNHIQGTDKSVIKVGLFFNKLLIAVMTFTKLRISLGSKHKDGSWELCRYCSKINTNIVGGANKLLHYFEQKYTPNQIISYADRRWSIGNMYKQLGFVLNHISLPNYWYTQTFRDRKHRYGFQKHILSRRLEKYAANKTEHENMLDNNYYRIYDCGNYVFKKTNI